MHQYTVEIFYFHIKSGLHFRVKRLESTVLQKAKQCLNIIRHVMRYDSTCEFSACHHGNKWTNDTKVFSIFQRNKRLSQQMKTVPSLFNLNTTNKHHYTKSSIIQLPCQLLTSNLTSNSLDSTYTVNANSSLHILNISLLNHN